MAQVKTAEMCLIKLAGQVDPGEERGPGGKKDQGKWGRLVRVTSPGLQMSLVCLILKKFKGIYPGWCTCQRLIP